MPYGYLWSNGSTDATISGIGAGTYTVTVTDANGCNVSGEESITNDASNCCNVVATCTPTNVNCNGGSDGSISVSLTGSTAPVAYLWSNGSTDAIATGLVAGSYTVIVTDANGCTAECTSTITEPTALTATCSATDASCGLATGTATVTAADGTAPYSYSWSNGSTDASITGLAAGVYTATVTDANGCIATCESTVNNLNGPSNYMLRNRCTCNGGSDG
ncbi:MAG: SprB repeat-containing protein [Bacteroidetes bacterium]|nr:SprB repeat-containing protein [Bacteroidota bacterium]